MNKMTRITLLALLLMCSTTVFSADEGEVTKPGAAPEAKVFTTQHELKLAGKIISYTATAGTMLMKNDKSQPIALMGYTAYVASGKRSPDRPIMFAYNGGPGSASIWLHMGILGPQRAVATDAGFSSNGPYQHVDNEFSIIDEVDLVMIDPVGTGFSKPVGEGKGEDFWGVDQDIKSVSDFIVQYVTENGRWASPKYILGESYGGVRSGGVAWRLLTQNNMALNGVVLVSPFMEMATGFVGLGIDLPHVLFLPSFAATAWYHDALDNKAADMQVFLAEVEQFAQQEYAPALLMGSALPDEKRQQVLAKLARYTGVDEQYWDRANLRVSESQFNQELLRDRGETVGRADSRFKGDSINLLGEHAFYDPFGSSIGPSFLAAFMDYYRSDLDVVTDQEYVVSGKLWSSWDWGHAQPDQGGFIVPFPNTLIDLSLTMKQNPNMKVLYQQGYFDLATPYFACKYYIDHMDITPELRENVSLRMYDAGHMMYIHEESMAKYKLDLAEFVRESH
jgi:carboxypeptidase C (cathepsin A)